ncbi:MAG: PorT family protein [Prevotella sp.]|nr:PorT family protein [Prevotella sp.]MBR1464002.1 PorT family protein [Prevotella sp.]
MKKLLLMAAVLMTTLTASAQHATGSLALKPTIGLNLSNFTGCDWSTKMRPGLAVGVEGEYQATPFLGISAGFLYSMQGAKLSMEIAGFDLSKFASITAKVDYLNVPILANVYVAQGLALKAGLQLGVNMSSDIDANVKVIDSNYNLADVTDYTESIDFAIPVGISYEYENFVIDARYNIGLTDVYKKDNIITNLALKGIKNSTIMITLGYKFDL